MGAPTPLGAAPELKDSTTYVPAELFNVLYCNPDTVKEDGGKIIINTNADGGDSVQIPNPFERNIKRLMMQTRFFRLPQKFRQIFRADIKSIISQRCQTISYR